MIEQHNGSQTDIHIVTEGGAAVQGSVTQGDNSTFIGRDAYYGYTAEQVRVLIREIRHGDQPKTWDGRVPFMGLNSFREADAHFFFGREALVETLLGRLARARFLCVAGPSGSGKSSLVRAGLIHSLRLGRGDGSLSGSDKWPVADLTPRHDPMDRLALAMARVVQNPSAADYLKTHGTSNPLALHTQAETLLGTDPRQRLIVFVDQFEEIFTQTKDEDAREQFVAQLTRAATVAEGRVSVLLSLRSDFVSQCAAYPHLREQMSREFQLVGAMTPDELARAIALPVMVVGASIEPELVAQIIHDMKGEPGALPLVQFALRDLFTATATRAGAEVKLTLDAYLDRGGVDRALERHADDELAGLDEIQQRMARTVFTRVVEIGSGRADTRRIASFNELATGKDDPEQVYGVVRALADEKARLLTTSDRSVGANDDPSNLVEHSNTRTVTLAHERLIDTWPWLRKLIDENREAIRLLNEIGDDARKWEVNNQEEDFLYRGVQLAHVQERLAAAELLPSEQSQRFLDEGVKRQQLEEEEKEAEHRRQLEEKSRIIRRLMVLLLSVLAFGLIWGLNEWSWSKSPWQRVSNFPAAQVSSIEATHLDDGSMESTICVATTTIGVGCSLDGMTWNVYQQGLATGSYVPGGVDGYPGAVTGLTSLGINSENFNHLIAADGDLNIYESLNGGVSWEKKAALRQPGFYISRLIVRGRFIVAFAKPRDFRVEEAIINVSYDGGHAWEVLLKSSEFSFGKIYDVLSSLNPLSNDFIYVASEAGLYRSRLLVEEPWEQVVPIRHIRVIENEYGGNSLQFVTFDEQIGSGHLYHWDISNSPVRVASIVEEPKSLAPEPFLSSGVIAYVLTRNNSVLIVDRDGTVIPVAKHPRRLSSMLSKVLRGQIALFISDLSNHVNDVQAVPDLTARRSRLWIGHPDGLLEYAVQQKQQK